MYFCHICSRVVFFSVAIVVPLGFESPFYSMVCITEKGWTSWLWYDGWTINLHLTQSWLTYVGSEEISQKSNYRHQKCDIKQVRQWGPTNIGHHRTNFSRHGDVALRICTPLTCCNVYRGVFCVWYEQQSQLLWCAWCDGGVGSENRPSVWRWILQTALSRKSQNSFTVTTNFLDVVLVVLNCMSRDS